MSAGWVHRVLQAPVPKGAQRLIAVVLAWTADEAGRSTASAETITALTGRSDVRNVRRDLGKMEGVYFDEVERPGTSKARLLNGEAFPHVLPTPGEIATPTPGEIATPGDMAPGDMARGPLAISPPTSIALLTAAAASKAGEGKGSGVTVEVDPVSLALLLDRGMGRAQADRLASTYDRDRVIRNVRLFDREHGKGAVEHLGFLISAIEQDYAADRARAVQHKQRGRLRRVEVSKAPAATPDSSPVPNAAPVPSATEQVHRYVAAHVEADPEWGLPPVPDPGKDYQAYLEQVAVRQAAEKLPDDLHARFRLSVAEGYLDQDVAEVLQPLIEEERAALIAQPLSAQQQTDPISDFDSTTAEVSQ